MHFFDLCKVLKITNSKHQITNKSHIPIFNDRNIEGFEFGFLVIGICLIFGICDLYFKMR